jgi:hypothetical protein
MMKHLSHIKHTDFKKIILPLVVIVIVAIGGTYFLLSSHAATPYVAVTADSGTPTSPASTTSCSGSTDGSCVLFGPATTGTGGGSGPGTQTDCFASPGKCGYPDPAAPYDNVGSTTPCASLPTSNGVTVSTAGTTVQNISSDGIDVEASNVTIKNVCVITSGGSGTAAINIGPSAQNITIDNATLEGTAANGNGNIESGVFNHSGNAVTANAVYVTNSSDPWEGAGTINNSYFLVNGVYSGAHAEDIYVSDDTVTLTHDTLLNSQGQTAVLFGDNYGGSNTGPATNNWTVKNSLLAGGGYLAYFDARGTSAGSSKMDIENNRWARCTGKAVNSGDGVICSGLADSANDGYGYYPRGGYYGGPIDGYCGSGQTWTGNVWDDDNSTLSCD